MNVLIACERSGIGRDAFTAAGHKAVSCDLVPSETPGMHYTGDVRKILSMPWDLMIAHPPCTYLSNAGIMHFKRDKTRWELMLNALDLLEALYTCDIPRVAIENPPMHRYALEFFPKPDQTIQPHQFGDAWEKPICLWLKNLDPLVPGASISNTTSLVGTERDPVKRARSFPGVYKAMVRQWTS